MSAAFSHLFNTEASRAREIQRVKDTWEKLRGYPEIAAIEAKAGKITLTVDYAAKTGYIAESNTIVINPGYIKDVMYPTVMTGAIDASIAGLSDAEYWAFVDSYPESYSFSITRSLVHEAYHALQPDYRLLYSLNPTQFETPVIRQTNDFMWKYFREPARDPYWH